MENILNITRLEHSNSYTSPTPSFQEKEKTFYTPGLPNVISSQNYDIFGVVHYLYWWFTLVWYSEKGGLMYVFIHCLPSDVISWHILGI